MSGPLSSLRNSTKRPNGQSSTRMVVSRLDRQKTVLKSNSEEDSMTEVSWYPPETKAQPKNGDFFITTEENFTQRKNRAIMTLRYLVKNTVELIEEPSKYISDVWWFRYLSSIKHSKADPGLTMQAEFIQLGLPKLFKSFWADHLCVSDIRSWDNTETDSIEALYHITMGLWFISTNPTHQQEMFTELSDFVLAMISNDAFQRFYRKEKRIQDCLKALLGIVYQFAKNINKAKEAIRAKDGVVTLHKLGSGKSGFNKNVRGRALMILAYVLNEEEQKEVNAASSVIEFMISLLKDCLNSADHRSPTHNYEAIEILIGLNKMAISDANKIKINDNDGLPLYLDLLKSSSLVEQEEACKGLWTLCFNQLVAENVSKDERIMSVLRSLTNSEHSSLRDAASGCLWTVQQLQTSSKLQAERNVAGHVMISYSWSVQTEAKEIRQRLSDSGYRVWIDIEHMSGSTLSSMSQAIEKAAVVLILLSEQYKISPACRAEAEYAYKLKKDIIPLTIQAGYAPDGWLGMLLGLRSCLDLSKELVKEDGYQQLVSELGDKAKGPSFECDEEEQKVAVVQTPQEPERVKPAPSQRPAPAPTIKNKPQNKELECMSWSKEDVNKWMLKHKLQEFATSLGDEVTGDILVELKYLFVREIEHYYELVRTDLRLPALTLLRLSAALRHLK